MQKVIQISQNRKPEDSSENEDEPQIPVDLHPKPKKTQPSIDHQDKNSFFFTMVDVQGNDMKQRQMFDRSQQSLKEESQQQPQIANKSVNPLQQVKLLLEKFNKFDYKLLGMIGLQDAKAIFHEMGMNISNFETVSNISIMTKKQHCTFDEFLAMLNEFQQRRFQVNQTRLFIKREFKTDPRLIAFIRLLDQYRRKNQSCGEYKEAKSAKVKIKQIKEKQAIRKQSTLRIIHNQQITSLEQLQRKQFQEFSDSWDKYMEEYQKAALQSLETLKFKHIKQIEEYDHKIREDAPKVYYSKQVLELRTKEKNLVKLQQYEEAGKVRVKIDDLEQMQRNRHEVDLSVSLQNKINNFRTKQTGALNALLKKIQKDRNQQLKTRQIDSERLIIKNRNMRNQLLHRHQDQIKRSIQSLKELMVDEGPRGEGFKRKSQSVHK